MATKKKTSAPKKAPATEPAASGGDGDQGTAPEQTELQPQMSVLAQFVRDLSFESPNAPRSLQGPGENPKMQVGVNVQANPQGQDVYDVSLNLEANASNDAGVIYNIELVYSGLFQIENVPQNLLQPVLFIDCPALLFPYARRIVSELTQDGAFPPLLLDPIDFASLYRQRAAQAQQQAETPSA